MNKKFKRFIVNLALTIVQISFVIGICQALQNLFGGGTLTVLVWSLYFILVVTLTLFGWRFYTGVFRDRDFLD